MLRKGLSKPLSVQDLDNKQLDSEKFEDLFKQSELNLVKGLKPTESDQKVEIKLPSIDTSISIKKSEA